MINYASEFHKNTIGLEEVREKSYKQLIIIMALQCLPNLIGSTIFKAEKQIVGLYLAMFLIGFVAIIEYILSSKANVYNKKQYLIKAYILFVLEFVLAVISEIIFKPYHSAFQVIFIAFIGAIWIIDIPYRVSTLFVIGSFAMIITSFVFSKDKIQVYEEIVNAISICMICIPLSYMRANAKLGYAKVCYRDMLTEALNRRAFFKFALEQKGKVLNLVTFDIDNFKAINDKLGHDYGDFVLKKLGEIFAELETQGIYVFRMGGEEFNSFDSNGMTSEELAKLIKSKIEEKYIRNETSEKGIVSVSLGGANIFIVSEKNVEAVYKKTDVAMYYSKEHGKDRYTEYTDIIQETP